MAGNYLNQGSGLADIQLFEICFPFRVEEGAQGGLSLSAGLSTLHLRLCCPSTQSAKDFLTISRDGPKEKP